MSRHSKLEELNPRQVHRIMHDASRLHESITEPTLKVGCEHHRALTELTEALVAASKAITRNDSPPWALTGSGHAGFFKPQDGKG